jgi:TPR repeat protein
MISLIRLFSVLALLSAAQIAAAAPFEAGLNAMDREHYATAFRAWKKLADQGAAEAQNNIGYLYEQGRGVKQSYARAIEWYKKAAEQDLAEAHHNLGMLAFLGYGMRKDYLIAKRHFTNAGDLDQADSEYMLGLIYHQGHGVKKNLARAKDYFLEAATHDSTKGQFMLAFMFQAGEGHPADKSEPVKAFIWGNVAARNGYSDAEDILSFSRMQMTESVQSKALELVTTCLESKYERCPE